MSISICSTTEIPDPGSKGFQVDLDGNLTDIFIIHFNAQFYAFINKCPHTGANLDWLEDQFLDMDNAFIQCATHDALFEIDTGLCVAGPCVDDHLTPLKIHINKNLISVEFL